MRSVFYPHLVNGSFGDPALYVRIAHRGTALLFDCGDLAALTGRELLKVRAVFVSHAHIDHLIGFDRLLRVFLYTDRTLLICGPPGFIAQIRARLASYTWNLVAGYRFVLIVREWQGGRVEEARFAADRGFRAEDCGAVDQPSDVLLATPDWSVRAVALEHGGIPSLAFVLEETLHVAIHRDALAHHGYALGPWLAEFKRLRRKGVMDDLPVEVPRVEGGSLVLTVGLLSAQIAHCERGMKLAYVTDADPSAENFQRIVALAADAHHLVIEAPFSAAEEARARERHHLTASLAGAAARAARVAKLTVFHHSPRYLDDPGRLSHEALAAFRGDPQGHGRPGQ